MSPVASRKGGGGLRVDSKAEVKSENNRSLRKMKKNRSIVRQMLFPSNPTTNNSATAATVAAAGSVASSPPSARPRGGGGTGKKAALDEANVNEDHQG